MFQRDNAAPVVDLADYRTRGTLGFQYRLEECWSNDKKLAAAGWVLRAGRDKSRRSVRVVLVADDDGQASALQTTLLHRTDVLRALNKQSTHTDINTNPGLNHSLIVPSAN